MIDYQKFRLPCRQGGSRCPWTQWKHDNRPNDGYHDNKRSIHEEVEESAQKPHKKEDCVDKSFTIADKNGDGVLNMTEYLDFMNVDRSSGLNSKSKRSISIWEDYFGRYVGVLKELTGVKMNLYLTINLNILEADFI